MSDDGRQMFCNSLISIGLITAIRIQNKPLDS